MKTLFRVFALLPLPLLHALGGLVGRLAYRLSGGYRRTFDENAAQAGYTPADLPGAAAEMGKMIAETPRLWFGRPVPVEWVDADVLQQARDEGRGLVLLTPHLGCFEVAAQGYASRFGPITVLYRPARKAWLKDIVANSRVRENIAAAPTTIGGVKQLLQALKAGQAVGMLPDQVPPEGLGVWAPFFGKPAYTMTLPARLVRQTGAAVVLLWGERLPGGKGFRLRARRWQGGFAAEPRAAAAQLNAQMESVIRTQPAQYLWGYARYKAPRGA